MGDVSVSDDRLLYDVLLVGGSPSSLALAHQLVDKCIASGQPLMMAILEKAPAFGQHVMSGAVSNPHVLNRLFPEHKAQGFPIEAECTDSKFTLMGVDKTWNAPNALLPPGLQKEGYYVLTLSKVVAWMAEQLEAKIAEHDDIHVDMLTGFSAHKAVIEDNKVVGVQVVEKAEGNPDEENIYAHLVCFGDKGFTSKQVLDAFDWRQNPQCWSVGVKEVWELPEGQNLQGKVWHTLGWPLLDGTFGGGFVYGMADNKLTVGLVISLDSENPNINPQQMLQRYKEHPWLQGMLKGGKLLKYGAATLAEGGYYSLPKTFAGQGALLLGDALGVLNIATLAGIDKALECGIQAAEVIYGGLEGRDDDGNPDFSDTRLADYQTKVMNTHVGKELWEGRYFRHVWKENPRLLKSYLPHVLKGVDNGNILGGFINVGLKNNPLQAIKDALDLKAKIEGKTDFGPLTYKKDHEHIVPDFVEKPLPKRDNLDESLTYSRVDAVWYAGPAYHEENAHIDEFNADTCVACITKYTGLGKTTPCVSDCTAEVHRIDDVAEGVKHGMSLENCIQCRTCEIVCPEENLLVRPTEQGSGPDFMGL
jgi:electron-transferring-flavoprotein dehydrogenase